MGQKGPSYPAHVISVATGQLLGLQVREFLRLIHGGQLVFRLGLDDHLFKEMTQEDPEWGRLEGEETHSDVGADRLPGLSSGGTLVTTS